MTVQRTTMNPRTWVRLSIAVCFCLTGLAETLSATGLVVELSPDGRWGAGVHTLAVSGPLQMTGAILLVFSRKTRWTLSILGAYVCLSAIFVNLPRCVTSDVGGNAVVGLLINVAVLSAILLWFRSERVPGIDRARAAVSGLANRQLRDIPGRIR